MKIKSRIYWSFSLLVGLFVINGIITIITLNHNKKLAAHISKVVDPSVQAIDEFKKMMLESKMYTTNWVFLRSKQEDKNQLKSIHDSGYNELKERINGYSRQWGSKIWSIRLQKVHIGFEQLLEIEKGIMRSLQKFEDYDDPVKKLEAEREVEDELLPRTAALINSLDNINTYWRKVRKQESDELEHSSVKLRMFIILLAITIMLAGLVLSIYMISVILKPINRIMHIVYDLGKGITRKIDYHKAKDEIGEMVQAVNSLSEKLQATSKFAYEVGVRNFDMPFLPLSDEDTLGRVLITMRDNLKTSEMELIVARDNAEAASRAKSDFMANMSHELRTPMNGIIGFTDLVLTTDMQKTQRDYLKNVSKSAYSLLNIINDILDFSKIEAGKLLIDETVFKLNELVEETVDILSIKAQEKNIELVCNIDPAIPSQFMGDPIRIKQVLVNLIGNAIKFTPKGEIFVNVQSGLSYEKDGEMFLDMSFSVKDTGIGIPQDKLNSIFESFTQADNSTTRKYGGTGLGLTISKRLVELMNGHLVVDSEPGRGSTFSFHLALKVINAKPPITFDSRPLLREVLVIDDNETNCKLMRGIFEYLHIPCKICYSGAEALVLIAQALKEDQMFDLIITDHQMPVMDGITLVKEIKKTLDGHNTEPFILMLSSLEKTLYQQEAEKIGIDKFLSKPVKLIELNNILASIFRKSFKSNKESEPVKKIEKIYDTLQVLVVEDEPVNMLLISEVLGSMGVEVIKAENGKEALAVLSQHDPAIIFMDVNMPEMDGFTATGLIRQLPDFNHIPIVALTADAMKEDKERCLHSGMNDYISKPFRLEEIQFVLKKYCNQQVFRA